VIVAPGVTATAADAATAVGAIAAPAATAIVAPAGIATTVATEDPAANAAKAATPTSCRRS
jgi:hypothetical protein